MRWSTKLGFVFVAAWALSPMTSIGADEAKEHIATVTKLTTKFDGLEVALDPQAGSCTVVHAKKADLFQESLKYARRNQKKVALGILGCDLVWLRE